jgi:hypothetical protein
MFDAHEMGCGGEVGVHIAALEPQVCLSTDRRVELRSTLQKGAQ